MTDFYAKVSNDTLTLISKTTDRPLETLQIQKAKNVHRSYIISTWLKSYEQHVRRLRPYGLSIPASAYRAGEGHLAEALWSKSHVAVSGSDGYAAHAWVCCIPGKLYHAYVPPDLRLSGLARELVREYAGTRYSVHKPWPNGSPRSHTVTLDPWMIMDLELRKEPKL